MIQVKPRTLLSFQRDISVVTYQAVANLVAQHWKALGVSRFRIAHLLGASTSASPRTRSHPHYYQNFQEN